ncbi:hypothetical protein GCM10027085_08020 [Spirosoma aerophilum]
MQFVAVNVTASFGQIIVSELDKTGASGVFTVIFQTSAKQLMQPGRARQMAVYFVVCCGLTSIDAPVSPFDHTTVPTQPVAES